LGLIGKFYFVDIKTATAMEQETKTTSRKKFLLWGAAAISVFGLQRFFRRKKNEPETVKMLSSDGKLVEVNIKGIPVQSARISDTEIHDWINPLQKA
jgi:hypothetical protein